MLPYFTMLVCGTTSVLHQTVTAGKFVLLQFSTRGEQYAVSSLVDEENNMLLTKRNKQ